MMTVMPVPWKEANEFQSQTQKELAGFEEPVEGTSTGAQLGMRAGDRAVLRTGP